MPRRQSPKKLKPLPPKPKTYLGLRLWVLALLVLGLALIACGLFFLLQADPDEPSYRSPMRIERVQLLPGEDYAQSRVVSWRCGEELADSYLLLSYERPKGRRGRLQTETLRYQAEGQQVVTASGRGCYYQVALDSLQPGTQYRYRLVTGGVQSEVYSFRTPIEAADSLQLVYLGALDTATPQQKRQLLERIDRSFPDLDLLALTGNYLAGANDAAWGAWYELLGRRSSRLPQLVVPGTASYIKEHTGYALDPRWRAQYPYPTNGPEGYLGRSYYVDYPYVRFVVLDAARLLSWGGIQVQRSWLRQALQCDERQWRIVLLHLPVDRVLEEQQHLVMHYFLRDELIAAGADLILQGHDGCYGRASQRSAAGDTIPPVLVVSPAVSQEAHNTFDKGYDRLGTGLALYQHIVVSRRQLHYSAYRLGTAPPDSLAARDSLYDELVLRRTETGELKFVDRARALPEIFNYNAFASSKRGQKKAAQYQHELEARQRARREALKKRPK